MASRITRQKAGLAATFVPTEPWGVIMDWVVSQATATIIAFSNGHASIYSSTGGGFIGGGESLFYLLTDAGIFTAGASQEDLSNHHHPLSKLHGAAPGIITEYRLIKENK
jgi:hypothetical protein